MYGLPIAPYPDFILLLVTSAGRLHNIVTHSLHGSLLIIKLSKNILPTTVYANIIIFAVLVKKHTSFNCTLKENAAVLTETGSRARILSGFPYQSLPGLLYS